MPVDRTGYPGQGLEGEPDVLTYRDLVALDRNPDTRAPSRQLQIHLTGNMERYMWAFDGVKMNAVTAPIPFTLGERVRVTLVNDTMMTHPIHRSEEHTSELQSLMRISYAVFCLKKKIKTQTSNLKS